MARAIPNAKESEGIPPRTTRGYCPRGCTAVTRVVSHASEGLKEPWRVVQCQRCKLMFTDPKPPADDWERYYPSDYYPYQVKTSSHWRKRLGRSVEASVAKLGTRRGFERVASFFLDPTIVSPFGARRMVDIGCGAADYMVRLREAGWNALGLEPSPHAAERARKTYGVNVVEDVFPSNKLPRGAFDLVTAQQVLEHLDNPLDSLEKMRDLLRPSGRLLLTVPNAASWSSRFFGAAWIGWDLPRHLTHFTPHSLSEMVRECGFRVLRVHSIRQGGWIRTSASLADDVGLPASRKWFTSRQISNGMVTLARLADRSDSLFLLAERMD